MMLTAETLYKSLNIPTGLEDGTLLFNPLEDIGKHGDWNVILSIRAKAKTTNMLLLGLCKYWVNGIQTVYIRQYDDMLTPTRLNSLMDVIKKFNYIEKVTNGEFNDMIYRARRWTLVKRESGEIVKEDERPWCICCAINKEAELRSTLNVPDGDHIIIDEFCRADHLYMKNEFVVLCQLLSTIIRKRTTAKIYALGNGVDYTCPYFADMCITSEIKSIKPRETKYVSNGETVINISLLQDTDSFGRKVKSRYFPWQSGMFASINGGGKTWSIHSYPHAPSGEIYSILDRGYFDTPQGWICREIRRYSHGDYCMFYEVESPEDGRVQYSQNTSKPCDDLHRYFMGQSKTDKYVQQLVKLHYCYYSSNEVGEIMDAYFMQR